jgi:hypothetical protein
MGDDLKIVLVLMWYAMVAIALILEVAAAIKILFFM